MAKLRSGTLTQQLDARNRYLKHCTEADKSKNLQINDRVRYGKLIGTIDNIETYQGANMFTVRFDTGGRWAYRSVDLKRVKVRA